MSSGRRYINKLKTCLGPVRVEDLWIPYFCVSSDMSRCAMEVHREGELWKCALASGNLPGLLPPVVHEGRLLFDGMFFNDLPVDVMRGICGRKGEVIAVDVSAPNDLAHSEPFGDGLSGWRVLWSRLNPFVPTIKLPGIVSILQRSAEMSSISRRKSQLDGYADLYLRMPVEGFDLLDFGAGEDIFRVGYQYARERLQERSADRA
jgi:predicted acylesterase/phospholipase RssA